MNSYFILEKAKNKAIQSPCKYKISALGFNKRGELIGSSFNKPRFYRRGGSEHAEMLLMKNYTKGLATILICRVNSNGKFLPIEPCNMCQTKANELGIKIVTIKSY